MRFAHPRWASWADSFAWSGLIGSLGISLAAVCAGIHYSIGEWLATHLTQVGVSRDFVEFVPLLLTLGISSIAFFAAWLAAIGVVNRCGSMRRAGVPVTSFLTLPLVAPAIGFLGGICMHAAGRLTPALEGLGIALGGIVFGTPILVFHWWVACSLLHTTGDRAIRRTEVRRFRRWVLCAAAWLVAAATIGVLDRATQPTIPEYGLQSRGGMQELLWKVSVFAGGLTYALIGLATAASAHRLLRHIRHLRAGPRVGKMMAKRVSA